MAEGAPVRVPLGDVCIHQVEEVSRMGLGPLACNGLSPFPLLFVAAECWAFVLQEAHGCFKRPRAVRVAAVVLYGYAFWFCPLAGEYPFCRGCLTPGHMCWAARRYCVKPGGEPCLLVRGGGGGGRLVVGGHEVQ